MCVALYQQNTYTVKTECKPFASSVLNCITMVVTFYRSPTVNPTLSFTSFFCVCFIFWCVKPKPKPLPPSSSSPNPIVLIHLAQLINILR